MILGDIKTTDGLGCDCPICQNAPICQPDAFRPIWRVEFADAAAVLAFIAAHGECVITVGSDAVLIEIYNDYRE